MNSNHFNPQLTYQQKVKRISTILADLQSADDILRELPEDAVQAIWVRVASHKLPPKSIKSKVTNKGVFKRSMKKTLEALIVSMYRSRHNNSPSTKKHRKGSKKSTTKTSKQKGSA